jgi:hypothetical protein
MRISAVCVAGRQGSLVAAWMVSCSATLFVTTLTCVPQGVAQTVKAETQLFSAAGSGKPVGVLKAGVRAEVMGREGFWVRVRTASATGWIKVSSLQFGSGIAGNVPINTGRLTANNIVTSSSARALTPQAFTDADPDLRTMAAIASYIPNSQSIAGFSRDGGLVARVVPPLAKRQPDATQRAPEGKRPNNTDRTSW